jgi:hypothetical protein
MLPIELNLFTLVNRRLPALIDEQHSRNFVLAVEVGSETVAVSA